jgi:hypothetical protein
MRDANCSREIQINVDAYKSLFEIEIVIREFIISSFNNSYGRKFWMNNKSGPLSNFKQKMWGFEEKVDFYTKIDSLREQAIKTGWNSQQSREIHGIYFLLFTDLKEILNFKNYKNSNQEKIDVFPIDMNKLKMLISNLESVFSIRNKLAHSVFLTTKEADLLTSFRLMLGSVVGDFDKYLNNAIRRCNCFIEVNNLLENIAKVMLAKSDISVDLKIFLREYDELDITLDEEVIDFLTLAKKYSSLQGVKGSSVHIKNLIDDNIILIEKFGKR